MPTNDYEITRGYLQRRYQEARIAHCLAQIPRQAIGRRAQPGRLDRFALAVGEFLVSYGLKLKERYWMAAGRPRHFFILDLGGD